MVIGKHHTASNNITNSDSGPRQVAVTLTPGLHPRHGCESGKILSSSDCSFGENVPVSGEMSQWLRFQAKCFTGSNTGSAHPGFA